MGSAKDFSALNTKISSMKKILLTDDDYEKLLNTSNLEEILDILFEKKLISKKDYKYPNQIEVDLKKSRTAYLNKLKHYLGDEYDAILDLILDKYYIEDIKKAARNIMNKNKDLTKDSFIVRKDFYDHIESGIELEEFFDSLKDTKFYKYIRGYKNQGGKDILFFIEMSLDRNYFSNIFLASDKLRREDRKITKKFCGEYIDLYNIEWIYRAKKFYDIPPVVIFNYSIAGGETLSLNDIKDLSYKSLDDFRDYILETNYSFIFDSSHDIELYMERRINRYLYYQTKDFIKVNKFNFSKTLGLILMTEFNVEDIGTILETKKFEMDKEEIKKYLIKNIERNV